MKRERKLSNYGIPKWVKRKIGIKKEKDFYFIEVQENLPNISKKNQKKKSSSAPESLPSLENHIVPLSRDLPIDNLPLKIFIKQPSSQTQG